MMILTAKTVVSAIRPPYPYGGEFIGQFLFALQLCWFPMIDTGLRLRCQACRRRTSSLFGALDRLGGFFVLASIREFAPTVTAVVVAGVAGDGDHRGPRRARSERSSTRSRCSASTQSRTWSCRASWR